MTNDHVIKKDRWKEFFNFVSQNMVGEKVELEVDGLDLWYKMQKRWTAIEGFTYEPKQNVLYFHFIELDHAIHSPQEIIVQEEGHTYPSIVVKDSDENFQIIKFKTPLRLQTHGRRVSHREPQILSCSG